MSVLDFQSFFKPILDLVAVVEYPLIRKARSTTVARLVPVPKAA